MCIYLRTVLQGFLLTHQNVLLFYIMQLVLLGNFLQRFVKIWDYAHRYPPLVQRKKKGETKVMQINEDGWTMKILRRKCLNCKFKGRSLENLSTDDEPRSKFCFILQLKWVQTSPVLTLWRNQSFLCSDFTRNKLSKFLFFPHLQIHRNSLKF